MKLETKIVSGECPSCKEHTMLVEIDHHFFRCITCGEDLEQKINGVIKYMKANKNTEMRLRLDID
jgi:Fe2+ or Zn2+ uptake regulation protein